MREQVLVEMLILEVSEESLREIGVDWATLDEPSPSSVRGFGMTNLGPRVNFLSGTAEGLVDRGLEIGRRRRSRSGPFSRRWRSNPASTSSRRRNILASNHRKAKIIVGENRAVRDPVADHGDASIRSRPR